MRDNDDITQDVKFKCQNFGNMQETDEIRKKVLSRFARFCSILQAIVKGGNKKKISPLIFLHLFVSLSVLSSILSSCLRCHLFDEDAVQNAIFCSSAGIISNTDHSDCS